MSDGKTIFWDPKLGSFVMKNTNVSGSQSIGFAALMASRETLNGLKKEANYSTKEFLKLTAGTWRQGVLFSRIKCLRCQWIFNEFQNLLAWKIRPGGLQENPQIFP